MLSERRWIYMQETRDLDAIRAPVPNRRCNTVLARRERLHPQASWRFYWMEGWVSCRRLGLMEQRCCRACQERRVRSLTVGIRRGFLLNSLEGGLLCFQLLHFLEMNFLVEPAAGFAQTNPLAVNFAGPDERESVQDSS